VTAEEVRAAVEAATRPLLERSAAKYGKPWSGLGIYRVKRAALAAHRDAWRKVAEAVQP
jgi:hypothetical protein